MLFFLKLLKELQQIIIKKKNIYENNRIFTVDQKSSVINEKRVNRFSKMFNRILLEHITTLFSLYCN